MSHSKRRRVDSQPRDKDGDGSTATRDADPAARALADRIKGHHAQLRNVTDSCTIFIVNHVHESTKHTADK